jgi:hypothetical protein
MGRPSPLNRRDARTFSPLLRLATTSTTTAREKRTVGVPMHRARLVVVVHALLLFVTIVAVLSEPCLAVEFLAVLPMKFLLYF